MSSREFSAWLAYDRLQPIGDRRLDLNFAHLCALVAGAISGRRTPIAEFDLFDEASFTMRQGRSVEAQKAAARALTRMMGGKIIEGGARHDGDNRGP